MTYSGLYDKIEKSRLPTKYIAETLGFTYRQLNAWKYNEYAIPPQAEYLITSYLNDIKKLNEKYKIGG